MHRPRVLIVDDNAYFIELLSGLLTQEFQIIGTAPDGAAAVEASIRLQPDVVVSDISMPRMNGLELADRLRALNHSARVVIVTLHEDLVQNARENGALGYVLKSRAFTDLPVAVRRALDGLPFVSPSLEPAFSWA